MEFQSVSPDTMHATSGYAHAVRMGDLLFVSGQVAMTADGTLLERDDVRAQTEQVFANLRTVLEAAGSGLDRVGKLTVLATTMEALPIIREVRQRLWAPFGYEPASTFALVAGLASPEILVEVEAVAAIRPPAGATA